MGDRAGVADHAVVVAGEAAAGPAAQHRGAGAVGVPGRAERGAVSGGDEVPGAAAADVHAERAAAAAAVDRLAAGDERAQPAGLVPQHRAGSGGGAAHRGQRGPAYRVVDGDGQAAGGRVVAPGGADGARLGERRRRRWRRRRGGTGGGRGGGQQGGEDEDDERRSAHPENPSIGGSRFRSASTPTRPRSSAGRRPVPDSGATGPPRHARRRNFRSRHAGRVDHPTRIFTPSAAGRAGQTRVSTALSFRNGSGRLSGQGSASIDPRWRGVSPHPARPPGGRARADTVTGGGRGDLPIRPS